MEYQKIIHLLDNAPNQPSKFRIKSWVEINDHLWGTCNTNSQINFKTLVLNSSVCDCSDAYILVKGRIKITGAGAQVAGRQADEKTKGVIFKNCAPFNDCISKINNTQVDNAKDLDVEMTIYILIEHSDNDSKTSGSFWQYYRDEPNNTFTGSESFTSKIKIIGNTPADGNTKDVEIAVPLKYLNYFRRNLEIPFINCKSILV